ncbi:MAG: radical SAM protein, partial [Myxococcota bacterium]|nr:radical SAM protein [Myxococcota bacterium]
MVRVNGVCNATCAFCELSGRRGLEGADLSQVYDQLQRDRDGGATRLRVSGGEPLMEAGLWPVLERAQELGFDEVILETNGTLARQEGVATALSRLGVTRALWSVYSPESDISDGIYGAPGMHAASIEGARALMSAGIQVLARTPLSSELLGTLAQVPAWLSRALPGVAGWRLRPLMRSERSRYEETLLPSLKDLADGIRAAHFASRAEGLPVEIEDELGLPLCLFAGDNQSLRSLQRHPNRSRARTHTKAEDCINCVAGGQCPGQPLSYAQVHGPWDVAPFDRIPQALVARSSRPETYVIYDRTQQEGDQLTGAQVTIRVVMPCNQDCTFCFVDRTSPGLGDDAIFAAIDEAADKGASRVSFSGGEPTLHRRLPEFVQRATDKGLHEREIQTNALRLTDPSLCDDLVAAGLTQAVVSLHA